MAHQFPPGEELVLEKSGLSYEIRSIKIADIDFGSSEKILNAARLGEKFDEQHILDLTAAYNGGEDVPTIIVARRPKDARWSIWSGNHRGRAAKNSTVKEVLAACVVTNDELLWDLMPRSFNRTGSRKSSTGERTAHAKHAIKTWGYTTKQAAEWQGLTDTYLRGQLRVDELREACRRVGLPDKRLTNTAILKLGPLAHSDVLLAKAGKIAIDARLVTDEIQQIVQEAKRERSEESRIRRLDELKDAYSRSKPSGNGHARDRSVTLRIGLSSVKKVLLDISTVTQLGVTDAEEIRNLNGLLKEVAKEMLRVAKGEVRREVASRKKANR